MVASTPTIEPTQFYKGDSVSWKRSLANYPASNWTLTYYIRGASYLDIACSADGNDHLAEISAAQTGVLTAGQYWWQAKVTDGASTYTVANGQFDVLATFAGSSATYDGRSHVKITLDALEAVIEGRATVDQSSYSIGGRSLSRMSIEEMLKWRDKYKQLYQQELRREQIANGIPGRSSKIQVRFNS